MTYVVFIPDTQLEDLMPPQTDALRHIVITGGMGALGKALTRVAKEAGYVVTTVDRTKVVVEAGDHHLGGVDLSCESQVVAAMGAAVECSGPIFSLFNVGGAFQWSKVRDTSNAFWLQLFVDNCLATLGACRAAIPHMSRGGTIVNVAAASALSATTGMAAYSASKAAVLRLSEALDAELSEEGIRVRCILPTILDTPRNRLEMPDADWSRWENLERLSMHILDLALWTDDGAAQRN